MTLGFEYKLTGSGWAESTISDDSGCLTMRVSYLSDALGELAETVLRLLRNSEKEEVAFMDEPGEHRWLLQRARRRFARESR